MTVTPCMHKIALVQAVGVQPARRGGAVLPWVVSLRGAAAARRPADTRSAAGGGRRAHTSGGVTTRAAGHGVPIGRRYRRRGVSPPGVAPPAEVQADIAAELRLAECSVIRRGLPLPRSPPPPPQWLPPPLGSPPPVCGVARAASGFAAAAAAVPLCSTACKRLLKSQLSHQAYAEGIP